MYNIILLSINLCFLCCLEFSAIDMLCDVACSALKARITHKSSENKVHSSLEVKSQ